MSAWLDLAGTAPAGLVLAPLALLENTFDTRSRSVNEAIDTRISTLTSSLTGGTAQVIQSLDSRLAQLTTSLTDGTARGKLVIDIDAADTGDALRTSE